MDRFSPSSRIALSLALGVVLASASGPAGATLAPAAGSPVQRFELIPAEHAAELPAELRAPAAAPTIAETLGLAVAAGGHRVQLHWVVREGGGLSGYRVTLVAPAGLPGHLAARWWVPPAQGTPVGDGLTSYSAEISLAFAGQAPVSAAIEAIDRSGQAVLLGVRRSVAAADPIPDSALTALPPTLLAGPTAVAFSRATSPVAAAAPASALFSLPPAPDAHAPRTDFARTSDHGGSVSGRGPPTERLTSSLTGA